MANVEKFSDLKFKSFCGGISSRVAYGDYELSIVRHGMSYGHQEGLYEIGVSKIMETMVKITGTDGVQK